MARVNVCGDGDCPVCCLSERPRVEIVQLPKAVTKTPTNLPEARVVRWSGKR